MQLTEAEAAFRTEKSDLCIRPIWHHKEDRVLGHILVCFLAYALWKTLSGWQQRAGLGSSPRTILEELRRIQSVDVVLPVEDGREMRIRCCCAPTKLRKRSSTGLASGCHVAFVQQLHFPPKCSAIFCPLVALSPCRPTSPLPEVFKLG